MNLSAARKLWDDQDKIIARNVRIVIAGLGVTEEYLAKQLGMSRKTLIARMKNPKEFRASELRVLNYLAQNNEITLGQMI